jgi:hypothetical protein
MIKLKTMQKSYNATFVHEKTPHLTTGFFGLFLLLKKVLFVACFVGGISADYNGFFSSVK